MLTYGLPLAGFEAFRAESHNQLGAAVDGLGARILALRPFPGLSAVANKVALPNGELWFCSYGVPLRLAFRESNYTRLQLPVKAANWGRGLCIDDVAAAVNVSVRSLYRTFKTYRGYAPMEFLKQCRLNEARRMLNDPGSRLNVTAVAMACGFGDLSHFSKDFASAFGEPPSAVARRRGAPVEQDVPVLLPRRSK